jgi:peroxiredoxin (alkyl hydroperoxide reductase subunit C)
VSASVVTTGLVLFFYPLDFTFVCPTEITAFSDRVAEFDALGAKVVGASVDSKFSHLAWVQTPRNKGGLGKMAIPLLADITKSISRDYGVLVEDPADGLCGVTLRGTFVIDPKGVVRSVTVNDEAVGRSVDEVLRTIQALQYADVHGVGCPAGWRPGSKTITPNPKDAQKYFSDVAANGGSGAATATH